MLASVKPHVIQILTVMRVSLHVMFAGLLIFGIVRYYLELPTVPTDANNIAIAAAITLGIFYMIGTAWENRFARGDDIPDPGILSPVWLVIIVALWAFLVGASGYFPVADVPTRICNVASQAGHSWHLGRCLTPCHRHRNSPSHTPR